MHFHWRQRRAVHAPKASPLGANYSVASNEPGAVFSAASVASMVEHARSWHRGG